jgi:3-deoxy-D-manno-octulosonic-acid transferase
MNYGNPLLDVLMSFILDALYLVAGLLLSPMVLYRMIRCQRYRTGWGQRMGHIQRRDPKKKCIWIHAVSVGEVNAIGTVIAELVGKVPQYELIISTTTDTGYARAQTLYGQNYLVTFFPLDISLFVKRAFQAIDPALCLLMELEIWPNFMRIADHRGIPVIVLNGRISDRSFTSYCRAKSLLKKTFRRLRLVLPQTQAYADRFIALGCDHTKVIPVGSLKYDTAQVIDVIDGATSITHQLNLADQLIWVAGGTGPEEETHILAAYKILMQDDTLSNVRLIIVPRKPERFDRVAQLITQAGFPLTRYSEFKANPDLQTDQVQSVILGDTMGDLRKLYSLATVVFVGRSLVPMGGSDMIEVAALGKPTLLGPHTFNFRQTVDALLAAQGAVVVANAKQLADEVKICLSDKAYRERLARQGRQVILDNQGATARSVREILTLLNSE